jgi:hypothetical protein
MNIFLHQDGALGDVMLSLPAVRRLKQNGDRIHFAGRIDIGALLCQTGVVDEASSSAAARYASLYAGDVSNEVRGFLHRFERAWVFTADPGSALVSAVRALVPGTTVITTIPPAGANVPVSGFRLGQVDGGATLGRGPFMTVPPRYLDLAANMLSRAGYDGVRQLIAIHPGSGGRSKCWPLERYFALSERLQAGTGAFVIILTGPAEDDLFKDRIDAFSRGRAGVSHFADADLITVAALLGRSDRYVGNDSGVTHLASALGCRVLALFGPTDPLLWKPAGTHVEVVRSKRLAELSADEVYARITRAGTSMRVPSVTCGARSEMNEELCP